MHANSSPPHVNPNHWWDLVLDVTVPLVFAILTAGFFVLAAQ